jgi:hypothetical protein
MGRAKEAVPVMEKSLAMARSAKVPQEFLTILEGSLASIKAGAK